MYLKDLIRSGFFFLERKLKLQSKSAFSSLGFAFLMSAGWAFLGSLKLSSGGSLIFMNKVVIASLVAHVYQDLSNGWAVIHFLPVLVRAG
jgi:hypothetical protein